MTEEERAELFEELFQRAEPRVREKKHLYNATGTRTRIEIISDQKRRTRHIKIKKNKRNLVGKKNRNRATIVSRIFQRVKPVVDPSKRKANREWHKAGKPRIQFWKGMDEDDDDEE
jgi:hypothetical protein